MQFQKIAAEALEHRSKTKRYRNARSFSRWEQVVRIHLNPYLGKKDIKRIDNDTIVDVLSRIWEEHTPTAQMARVVLEYVIGYAIHKHYRPATDFNPARWKDGLAFDLSTPSDIHVTRPHEALTVGEAQRIMPILCHGTVRQKAVAFGIFTAGRASEFRLARWEEIDMEGRTFSVPVERCKVRRTEPFLVPLPSQAIDLLKTLDRKDSGYVFADTHGNPPCVTTLQNNLKKLLPDHANVTTHGCRSTFSSWCAETGKDKPIREACLMHVEGKVSRAYNRSEILAQRRLLMQMWADAVYHA